MTLKEIAFRNLLRRKHKAAFILAGLMIAVATIVMVVSLVDAMTEDINHKLETYGANILIVPRTENLTLTYGGLSLGGFSFEMEEILENQLAKVGAIKNAANIAAMGPMLLGAVQVRTHRVLLAGVDFESAKILKPWWKIEGALPDETGVLLGSEAALVMSLNIGSPVDIKGKHLQVAGILQPTGSQDDQLVFARLTTAQHLLSKPGRVSMAEVAALCKDCPIEDMVEQISEILPEAKVMAIQQVVKSRMEAIHHFQKFSYGLSVVVLLVGALVVLVTMMGSVRERTEEIGIFRAIGFRQSHVARIVLIEAVIVSGLAGLTGYFLGWGATKTALRFFSESHSVFVPFNGELAAGAFGLALFVGLASSIYPALLAARMDPNDALRAI